LRHHPTLQRKLRHLAFAVAALAVPAAWLTLAGTTPASAEFEIQEAEVENGEVELEYRGAYHWGLPGEGAGGILETEVGGGVEQEVDGEEEEVPLRQSHDFEIQMGITDRWMLSTALISVVPEGETWIAEAIEAEVQYELKEREGNGLGLAFQFGYGVATQAETANEIEFGPIVELATGRFLLIVNPFFSDQLGEFAETEGLGFEYGWRAKYDVGKHWGLGVEMFGEIEDLSNPGSFNDQEHSIGPTLFVKFRGEDDDDDEEGGRANGDDDDNGLTLAPRPIQPNLHMNVGAQFGLTDATSDGALKFQAELEF
jgi:hypothetical protein